jgi:hypothetical protein
MFKRSGLEIFYIPGGWIISYFPHWAVTMLIEDVALVLQHDVE